MNISYDEISRILDRISEDLKYKIIHQTLSKKEDNPGEYWAVSLDEAFDMMKEPGALIVGDLDFEINHLQKWIADDSCTSGTELQYVSSLLSYISSVYY